jgi:phage-related protein (TIGR01555 family)
MCKPYVDNWLRTRQSVSDLINAFSVMGLKTDMSEVLTGGGADELTKRVALFNTQRDNRGLMVMDKDAEEFFNVSAPLSNLDALQAQAQEHQAAAVGIPLAVFLMVTPKGLNATSEGDLDIFYSWIAAQQEGLNPFITKLLNIVQLSLYGEIDPDIGHAWEPLENLDEGELATARKTDAETDALYIESGVLSPEEVRQKLAAQEESSYASLDLSAGPPDTPDDDDAPTGEE